MNYVNDVILSIYHPTESITCDFILVDQSNHVFLTGEATIFKHQDYIQIEGDISENFYEVVVNNIKSLTGDPNTEYKCILDNFPQCKYGEEIIREIELNRVRIVSSFRIEISPHDKCGFKGEIQPLYNKGNGELLTCRT